MLDQLTHLAIEECQQKRPDVRSVDVRVGHDDDLVIAQLCHVEVILTNAGAQRGDHRGNFRVREHLVVARFLDVENLSLDRQNGLRSTIPSLFCGTTCGIAFHDKNLGILRRALLAIRQFSRQRHAVERALTAHEFTCASRGLSRPRSLNGFADDLLGH